MKISPLLTRKFPWSTLWPLLMGCFTCSAVAELTLIPDTVVVDADSQQRFGIVVVATQNWTWRTDVDWIVSTDEDDSEVFWYTFAANPESVQRTGIIEFRCGDNIRFFPVMQKGRADVPFGITQVSITSDGSVTLRWPSAATEKFAIEVSDMSQANGWAALPGGPVVADSTETSQTLPVDRFADAAWYRVRKGFPNLVPDSVTVSQATAKPGETIKVTWNLANAGDADALATVSRVQLNQTSTTTGGYEMGDVEAPPVKAGEIVEQSLEITVPEVALSGAHYVWIIVDRTNVLTRVHEVDDNSRRSEAFTVTQE